MRLGAFEKQRSGGIKLDFRRIHRAAGEVISQFEKCKRRGDIRPRRRNIDPVFTQVRDAKTGKLRYVAIVSDEERHLTPATLHIVDPVENADLYRESKQDRIDVVTLHLPRRCNDANIWFDRIRGLLAHELTHASDPLVVLRTKQIEASRERSLCVEVKREWEVPAYLNEVRYEIASDRYARRLKHPIDRLRASPTWRAIRRCRLPQSIRRRFLRMAARL